MAQLTELDAMLRRLHLPTVCRLYRELEARAEKQELSYSQYLELLAREEIAHRTQTRIARAVRKAKFPFLRAVEEFDFTFQTSLRQSLLGSYLGPDFVPQARSLILYGGPGRGKTHLAVAVAYRAIQNGAEAYFTTAAHLIDHLWAASRDGRLRATLPVYTHPPVLVIDEVGYLNLPPHAANALFQVVNDRYLHKRPMIFTTNKPMDMWGKVLHDPDLAEAILDRVLERGRMIHLRGPSYRTRHLGHAARDLDRRNSGDTMAAAPAEDRATLESDPSAAGASFGAFSDYPEGNQSDKLRGLGGRAPDGSLRISGKTASEFPEPTPSVPSPGR